MPLKGERLRSKAKEPPAEAAPKNPKATMQGRKNPNAGGPRGQSRARTRIEFVSLSNLAKEFGPRALGRIVDLMDHAESEQVRLQAAGMILDRAYGKAREHVDISFNTKREVVYRSSEEVKRDLLDMGLDVDNLFKADPMSLMGDDKPLLIEHDANEFADKPDDGAA